ncbi:MAG: hypothetical protein GY865_11170 [candidate division Zixibacteria bacterium]|nr:hypothetical protein [candidate division Zixibacteria bacterium]
MRLIKREKKKRTEPMKLARFDETNKTNQNLLLQPGRKYSNQLIWQSHKYQTNKFKIDLFRFLRDNIPLLHSCIWTWSRLSSAPGQFEIIETNLDNIIKNAKQCLKSLCDSIYPYKYHRKAGMESFLPLLFNSLYTDGAFAGFLLVKPDSSGVERFLPVDPAYIAVVGNRPDKEKLVFQTEDGEKRIDSNDFYYLALDADINKGLGKSIMASVPFVAFVQQQLINDMQKTAHNAGYHRLHVKISPPEKLSGESDNAYVNRVNSYFDDTVSMIKNCEPEDNPVTWDNVNIDYVGPGHTRAVTNSWSMNHRAMIEEICAGTNLSPFLLGYNYGTTHNWAQFKYDLVMRQVVSVQRQAARFLEWIGNVELALRGFDCKCKFKFDNRLSYQATESAEIERTNVDNIIKLYSAGLITKETAQTKAGDLL